MENNINNDNINNDNNNTENKFKKLTGLWCNTDKNGEMYLTGSLGFMKITIFKNNYKNSNNHPDYMIFLSEKKKKNDTDSDIAGAPVQDLSRPKINNQNNDNISGDGFDEEVPF